MQDSKILIKNYPRIYQRPSFVMVGDSSNLHTNQADEAFMRVGDKSRN